MHALSLVYFLQFLSSQSHSCFQIWKKIHVTNYRPISIIYIMVLFKNFRTTKYDRTTKFLNDLSVLRPTQYGFRSNFSTEHAVHDIVN